MSPAEFQRPHGAAIVPVVRRRLATLVVAAAGLASPYPVGLVAAAVAVVALAETWLAPRSLDADLFLQGARPTPASGKTVLGAGALAAVLFGLGAWGVGTVGLTGAAAAAAGLALLSLAALAGALLGVRATLAAQQDPKAMAQSLTMAATDILFVIDLTRPPLRTALHAAMRLVLGLLFLAPFSLSLPRLAPGPSLQDAGILIVLAAAFLAGMTLLSQVLLILRWGFSRLPSS